MEHYIYKCRTCGFVHLVPAYWVSYEPEETVEMEHLDLKAGDLCSSTVLELTSKEPE